MIFLIQYLHKLFTAGTALRQRRQYRIKAMKGFLLVFIPLLGFLSIQMIRVNDNPLQIIKGVAMLGGMLIYFYLFLNSEEKLISEEQITIVGLACSLMSSYTLHSLLKELEPELINALGIVFLVMREYLATNFFQSLNYSVFMCFELLVFFLSVGCLNSLQSSVLIVLSLGIILIMHSNLRTELWQESFLFSETSLQYHFLKELPVAFILINGDNVICYENDSAVESFGSIIGRFFSSKTLPLISENGIYLSHAVKEACMRQRKDSVQTQVFLFQRGKHQKALKVNVDYELFPKLHIFGVYLTEITESYITQRNNSDKYKRFLKSSLPNSLQKSSARVLILLQLLQHQIGIGNQAQISQILAAAQFLNLKFNTLKDYFRLFSKNLLLFPRNVCLRKLLKKIQIIAQESFGKNKIKIKTSIHPNTPQYILGDVERISQVLVNLIQYLSSRIKQTTIYINIQNIILDNDSKILFEVSQKGELMNEDEISIILEMKQTSAILKGDNLEYFDILMSELLCKQMGCSLDVSIPTKSFSFSLPFVKPRRSSITHSFDEQNLSDFFEEESINNSDSEIEEEVKSSSNLPELSEKKRKTVSVILLEKDPIKRATILKSFKIARTKISEITDPQTILQYILGQIKFQNSANFPQTLIVIPHTNSDASISKIIKEVTYPNYPVKIVGVNTCEGNLTLPKICADLIVEGSLEPEKVSLMIDLLFN